MAFQKAQVNQSKSDNVGFFMSYRAGAIFFIQLQKPLERWFLILQTPKYSKDYKLKYRHGTIAAFLQAPDSRAAAFPEDRHVFTESHQDATLPCCLLVLREPAIPGKLQEEAILQFYNKYTYLQSESSVVTELRIINVMFTITLSPAGPNLSFRQKELITSPHRR